jgi:NADPH2:quinone reductase
VLALFGGSSGPVPPFDPLVLDAKGSLWLTRPSLRHFVRPPRNCVSRADEVLTWSGDGTLQIRIGGRYPLADAALAHEDLPRGAPPASCCC